MVFKMQPLISEQAVKKATGKSWLCGLQFSIVLSRLNNLALGQRRELQTFNFKQEPVQLNR